MAQGLRALSLEDLIRTGIDVQEASVIAAALGRELGATGGTPAASDLPQVRARSFGSPRLGHDRSALLAPSSPDSQKLP